MKHNIVLSVAATALTLLFAQPNTARAQSSLRAPDGSPNPALSVDNDGRVNIGATTANGSTRLQVAGKQTILSGWDNWLELWKTDVTPNTAWALHTPNPSGLTPTRLEFGHYNGYEWKWSRLVLTEDNVGIGTITPGATLEVRTSSWTSDAIRFGDSFGVGNLIAGSDLVAIATGDLVRRLSISQHSGNVGIGTDSPQARLDVAGQIRSTTLLLTSDRNAKSDFQSVNNQEVLKKVASLPLSSWNYTNAPGVRHIGPMAQDFKAAFPDLGSDDKHIATVDADGVALASIQALHQMVQEKDSEIAALKRQVSTLKTELAGVKESVTERLAALEKALAKDILQASFRPGAIR